MESLFAFYAKQYSTNSYETQKTTLFAGFREMMDGQETYSSEKKLELYNIIYSICTSHDATLSDRLYKDIYEFIRLETIKMKQQLQTSQNIDLLKKYISSFHQFLNGIDDIDRAAKYLTKYTIEHEIRTAGPQSRYKLIQDIGKIEWRENIYICFQEDLIKIVLTKIKQIRQTNDDNDTLNLIKEFCSTLIKLNTSNKNLGEIELYINSFETKYIKQLIKFTQNWANENSIQLNVFEYLKESMKLVETELKVIGSYLNSITMDQISQVMSEHLWKEKSDILISQIKDTFVQENIECIDLYFTVFSKCSNATELLNILAKEYGQWIKNVVLTNLNHFIAQNETEEKKTNKFKGIELLTMYIESYQKINEVKKIFNGNMSFEKETQKIMHEVLNSSENMYSDYHPKYIADYFDQLSRGIGIGKDGKENILKKIENISTILESVANKDIFMQYNTYYLARRLINKSTSFDVDIENWIRENLKIVCGYEYSNKLNNMVRDINSSITLNEEFTKIHPDTCLYVNVLTTNVWPFSSETFNNEALPPLILEAQKLFEIEYQKKWPNKILKWLNSVSTVVCNVSIRKYKYEVKMPIQYYIVLNLIDQYGRE